VGNMKASRWVDQGRVVCEEAPVPVPAEGELLVRTTFASLCGSDLHAVFLNVPGPGGPPGFPGHESVGEVVESRAKGFAPGDPVLTVPHAGAARCLAEYQALPAAACIKLPADQRLDHLLMAQQLGTVVYALRRHPLEVVGKDVVIVGQGSAGAFFTFLFRRAGAGRIVVADKSPARLAYTRRLGADVVIDATKGDTQAEVMAATEGRGGDVVVEAVGSRQTLLESVDLAATRATLIWFGLPEGGEPYGFNFAGFFRRQLTAYSVFGAQGEPGLVSFRDAVKLIVDGAIDVGPLLSHILPIERVEEAFHIAHDRSDNALKVSISF
jgi:L-iditol 2-dehydrogenase